MKFQTYLMSFGHMVRLLENHGIPIDQSRILNLKTDPARLICNGKTVTINNDLFEKLAGTWWEVELAGIQKTPTQYVYLADSLQDALRLRPNIDTSLWCGESEADFLAGIGEWIDDECFVN